MVGMTKEPVVVSKHTRFDHAGPAGRTEEKRVKVGQAKQQNLKASTSELLLSYPMETKWFEVPLPPMQDTFMADPEAKPFEVVKLRKERSAPLEEEAATLYQQQSAIYRTNKEADSPADADWAVQVLRNGTMTDKLSLMTLMVQEAPAYNLEALEKLLQMASKKARREAIMAIDAVKDLWLNNLTPTNRPLRFFYEQPINAKEMTPMHLLLFYVEDKLKHLYSQFLACLAQWATDTLSHTKVKIISVLKECLVAVPEGEKVVLGILVNKLGDKDRKVASKVVTDMSDVLRVHPAMKPFIVKEVLEVIWRPNVGDRAQYYALILLNQLVLTKADTAVASALIGFYCDFFERQVSLAKRETPKPAAKPAKKGAKKAAAPPKASEEKQEANPKLLSAILTGINRALPYSDLQSDSFEHHLGSIFKVMHTSPLPTSLQALHLIYRLTSQSSALETRFFRAFYALLHDARLLDCAKLGLFFNILYRSLKEDLLPERHAAFRKRVLQSCAVWDVDTTAGALVVLGEVPPTPVQPSSTAATAYDAKKREPEFAGAQTEQLWELSPLSHHFHPTLREQFVPALLNGRSTAYKGDPTKDFALARFLDRLSYRGVKSTATTRGNSAMQAPTSRTAWGTITPREEGPANERLPRASLKQVAPDEHFLWHYFDQSGRGTMGEEGRADVDEEITEKEEMDAIFKSGEDGLEPPEMDSEDDDDSLDEEDLESMDEDEEEDFEEEEEEEDAFATMEDLDLANAATFSDAGEESASAEEDDDVEAELEEEEPELVEEEVTSKRKRKRDQRSILQKTVADMVDTDGMMDADAFERLMQQQQEDSAPSFSLQDGLEEEEDLSEDGDIDYDLDLLDESETEGTAPSKKKMKQTVPKKKKK